MKSKIVSRRSCIRVLLPMMDTRCGESSTIHTSTVLRNVAHAPQWPLSNALLQPLISLQILLPKLNKKTGTSYKKTVLVQAHQLHQPTHLIRATREMGLPFPWLKYLSEGVKPRTTVPRGRDPTIFEVSLLRKQLMKRQPAGSRLYSQRDFKNR